MPGNNLHNNNQRRTSNFFDGYAHDFDAIYGASGPFNRLISAVFRRSMRRRYEKTLRMCGPTAGMTALDIGCGPGHYCLALAQNGLHRVIGIDFAPEMINLARARALESGVANKCEFYEADFQDYKFDQTFDFLICMGVLDYIPEPLSFIQKAVSLTRRRAMFSLPIAEGFLAWQRKTRYKSKCDLFLYRRTEVERLFAWFSDYDVRIEKLNRDYFVTVDCQ